MKCKTIFFDLDGTLIDTAPDLGNALNQTLLAHHQQPLPLSLIRPVASEGSPGLLKLGFNIEKTDANYASLREQFLTFYREKLHVASTLFAGVSEVLDHLDQHHYRWGIVTNKPRAFAEPLLESFSLLERSHCLVAGDDVTAIKPDPASLLLACQLTASDPMQSVYIGDALRDVQAAHHAGMAAVAALYGYIANSEDPYQWQAQGYIKSPLEIIPWLTQFLLE